MADMDKRIAAAACGLLLTIVAPLTWQQMNIDTPLPAAIGNPLLAATITLGLLAGAFAVWGDHITAWLATRGKLPAERWISIKQAVDYIKDESGWTTSATGVAWSDALEQDMRAAFGRFFGPAVRGRRYPIGVDPAKYQPPKLTRIPPWFWPNARLDSDEIRRTPARIIATNEASGIFYDDLEVTATDLRRAFPPKTLPPVPDRAPALAGVNVIAVNPVNSQTAHTIVNTGPPPPKASIRHESATKMSDGRWRHEWEITLTAAHAVSQLRAVAHTAVAHKEEGDTVSLRQVGGPSVSTGGRGWRADHAYAHVNNAFGGTYRFIVFTDSEDIPNAEVQIQ
jgi:hypothetical protein